MGLFVEAKGKENAACGLPVLGQQVLHGRQKTDQDVLAVAGTTAPEPFAVEVTGKWRVGPVGSVVDWHDILVSQEEDRLEAVVGAIEGVD